MSDRARPTPAPGRSTAERRAGQGGVAAPPAPVADETLARPPARRPWRSLDLVDYTLGLAIVAYHLVLLARQDEPSFPSQPGGSRC